MRRAVFRRTTTGLALFPFLAVLICTMGSLIVLLVLILQQTRANAATTAAAEETATAERLERDDAQLEQRRQQIEDASWRAEILDEQRRKQGEDLARGRLELSHLEDHIRRLQDQAKQFGEQLKQLGEETSDEDRAKMVEELERRSKEIEAARKKLEEAQAAAKKKNKSFTIIPYEGRQGTRRRPIYIECAEEGIILHPESIVFQPSDFSGPLGPGNPLDAALRTVREYLARYGDPAQTGEPYPLLIVRPNGAVAYAMARAAMKSWDDEFGYELIDGEMNLQFPAADPQLEQLLLRTLKDARHRQTVLAASMPSRYKGTLSSPQEPQETVPAQAFAGAPNAAARNSTQGGFGVGANGTAAGAGSSFAAGGTGSGTSRGATGRLPGPGGSGNGQGDGTEPGAGGGSGTGGFTGVPGSARGYADRAGGGTSGGTLANGATGSGGSGGSAGDGRFAGNGGEGTSGSSGGTNGAAGGNTGASGGQGATGGAGGGASGPAMMASGGGSSPTFSAGASPTAGSNSTAEANGASNDGSAKSSGARGGSSRGGSGGKFTMDGAPQGKEGEWALPGKSQRATAITRPIRVRCEPHRLVILPERGDGKRASIVPVPKEMAGSIDDFVSAIQKHMDGWGLAVVGGYWKPVLNVTVAPGGEAQFAELEALLLRSGIEIVRK